MRRVSTALALVLAAGLVVVTAGCSDDGGGGGTGAAPSRVATMRLTSPAFKDGEPLPAKYTCAGENGSNAGSPTLYWSAPPPATKELALVVTDPEGGDGDFVHFLFWGIEPNQHTARSGRMVLPNPGMNDGGAEWWEPPCPTAGSRHTYEFRVLALDRHPDVLMTANLQQFTDAIKGTVIGEGLLTATSGA